MRYYIGLIHKDADSDFGVSFPDFPGCVSAGETLDEAVAMGREALEGHVAVMAEGGEAIPEPTGMAEIMADPENRDGTPVLIPLAPTMAKTVRVNITMPADTLSGIDAFAEQQGYTRSGFLVAAARKAMERA
jgi:predicted RNase H-like HicB family nuclease